MIQFMIKVIKNTLFILAIIAGIFILNKYGIEELRSEVRNLGYFAPLGIFALRSISIVIPALPSTAYSFLAGTLFGFKQGIVIICLADLAACTSSFYLSKNYGRKLIIKFIGTEFIEKVENLSRKHFENNFFLMLGFLMTGLFDFVSYAIGLTKTPWRKFAPALVLSIILSNPPIVALGAGLLEGGRKLVFLGSVGIFLLAILSSRLATRNKGNGKLSE